MAKQNFQKSKVKHSIRRIKLTRKQQLELLKLKIQGKLDNNDHQYGKKK
jgi:hypothetical protein